MNSDKIRWAASNGQPACALAVWSVNPYAVIMWKSRYLLQPVLKSSWSHKYHHNDLIQIGFNGFNWQVYSIISDKQKLPKFKLRTIYNKMCPSWKSGRRNESMLPDRVSNPGPWLTSQMPYRLRYAARPTELHWYSFSIVKRRRLEAGEVSVRDLRRWVVKGSGQLSAEARLVICAEVLALLDPHFKMWV